MYNVTATQLTNFNCCSRSKTKTNAEINSVWTNEGVVSVGKKFRGSIWTLHPFGPNENAIIAAYCYRKENKPNSSTALHLYLA